MALDGIRAAGDVPDSDWMIPTLLVVMGDADEWFAVMHDEFDDTLDELSFRDRFFFEFDPSRDRFREDPRFQALMDRLPPYPGPGGRG